MVTDPSAVFRALGDPIRRRILERLRENASDTGAIARGFSVSRPAISKHLRVLVEAGLVRRRRVGRRCLYALHAGSLDRVGRWLKRFRRPSR